MKLVVLFITLVLRRMHISWPRWLSDKQFMIRYLLNWQQSLVRWGLPDVLVWAGLVLLPSVLTLIIFNQLSGFLGTLIAFALGIAMLAWLLGVNSTLRILDDALVLGRMNDVSQFTSQMKANFDIQENIESENYFTRLTHIILHREARSLFACIFYLITLGLPFALLYVLNRWLSESHEQGSDFAKALDSALFWLPARLLIFTLALAADFGRVMAAVQPHLWQLDDSDSVLADAMGAALESEPEDADEFQAGVLLLSNAKALLQRVLALWLIMAAAWVVILG